MGVSHLGSCAIGSERASSRRSRDQFVCVCVCVCDCECRGALHRAACLHSLASSLLDSLRLATICQMDLGASPLGQSPMAVQKLLIRIVLCLCGRQQISRWLKTQTYKLGGLSLLVDPPTRGQRARNRVHHLQPVCRIKYNSNKNTSTCSIGVANSSSWKSRGNARKEMSLFPVKLDRMKSSPPTNLIGKLWGQTKRELTLPELDSAARFVMGPKLR